MRGLLLASLLLTGCLAEPPASGANSRYILGGAFTAEATQEDINEAGRLAAAEGADMAILESFPAQFLARDLALDACERLRAALDAKPYVASVRECIEQRESADPDAPTSSPA